MKSNKIDFTPCFIALTSNYSLYNGTMSLNYAFYKWMKKLPIELGNKIFNYLMPSLGVHRQLMKQICSEVLEEFDKIDWNQLDNLIVMERVWQEERWNAARLERSYCKSGWLYQANEDQIADLLSGYDDEYELIARGISYWSNDGPEGWECIRPGRPVYVDYDRNDPRFWMEEDHKLLLNL